MSEQSRRASDRQLRTIIERYGVALRGADAAAAEAVVAQALAAGLAPTTIQVRVITPAMQRIGELWEEGALTVADEHLATVLSTLALLPLQEPLQIAPPRSRERVVLAAVEGQAHVLGLQMVADVLGGAGFEVLYLGADVPTQALRAFVAEHAPAVTGLSSTQARDSPRLAAAIVAIHDVEPSCRIMLGGGGVPQEWRSAPYPWVPNAAAVLEAIEGLLREDTLPTLPAAIARRRARGSRKPRPAARAREEEDVAADLADTSEVARRYARRAAEYRYLAYRDPLTALPNRRAFEDRMIALSQGVERHNAVLVIDVDEFKAFNDSAGHDAGDELLRRVGQAIHDAVRAGDTVARIGGDEFTVLLPMCTEAEATHVAEQVRDAVLRVSGGAVTVSIGAAPLGADRRSAILDADRALYAAKTAGRNRTQVAG
ncbi:MAG TPA: diguanylate cyclase [Solirubrobacteraceae bacterium]|jgi:diguanylate cyclase (GGDEF)-like protein|nr:diguanylate cyclase [Solirubrobacteraceae bacterium]